ncbi:MAG: site-specific integrase [Acidobacteria bacterium]|nr:site-specific integrase [Acidobacteriota bacterium]
MRKRRQQYQHGYLQKKARAEGAVWIGRWREDGKRKSVILGLCSTMTKSKARSKLDDILAPLNAHAGRGSHEMTVQEYIEGVYLPFGRRRWKDSTKGTTEQRISTHIAADLGGRLLRSVTRDDLQSFLDAKAAAGLSFSVVDHLRWDLNSIFALAANDGLVAGNPAEALFTPRECKRAEKRVMSPEDVVRGLAVLPLRERLIVKLAVLAGMRPGEIFGLRWPSVAKDHAVIRQRIYRGKTDTPKTTRSSRIVAFPRLVIRDVAAWRELALDSSGWVFPSERLSTPLWRDNVWNRSIAPVWKKIGLEWATFQVMRRTYATLSKVSGADPKVTADQMGHGLGVNLDVYARSGLPQLVEAVGRVEAMLESVNGPVM